jgi:hypothetical protein
MLKRIGDSEKIKELKGKLEVSRQRLDKEKLKTARYGCAGILAIIAIFIILIVFGVCPGKLP